MDIMSVANRKMGKNAKIHAKALFLAQRRMVKYTINKFS